MASGRKPVSISGSKILSLSTSVLRRTGFGRFGPASPSSSARNQDVGECYDGIHAEPAKRLERDFLRQFRRLANLKESVLCADFTILRQVPASLPHHPNGYARQGFPAAGAEE
jgi:hypothetical protein